MTALDVDVSQVLAPLIIGVTGHRDLRPGDYDALSQQVRSVLIDLKQQHPFTPLVLLSPLAEGADRLVARIALQTDINARLVVPLPMPRRVYEEDFQSADSLAEFNALLGQASHSFELGLCDGNTEDGLRQPGQRDRQYQAVGQFIARESQVLIAMWDGVETNLVGGTAQVVRFRTEGVPDETSCEVEPPEGFPVCHILTPRGNNPNPHGYPRGPQTIYPAAFKAQTPDGKRYAETYFGRMFGRLDKFNRLVSQRGQRLLMDVEAAKRALVSDREEKTFPSELQVPLTRYAFADALAIKYQRWTNHVQKMVHGSVFLAFVSFVLFAHLPEFVFFVHVTRHWLGWLLLSFIFLMVGLAYYGRAKRLALDTSHQDYRAIAEGMRVSLFWRRAGVNDSVMVHYLRKHRTELDWIRNDLRSWHLNLGNARSQPHTTPLDRDGARLVLDSWVESQRQYFDRAEMRDGRKSESLETITVCTAVLGIGLALVIGAVLAFHISEAESTSVEVGFILVETLLAVSAITHHYNEKMAFSEHAKQYSRMKAIFARAQQLVGQAIESNDLQKAQECLRSLGREALGENGDWVLLHRQRPLEMPHP